VLELATLSSDSSTNEVEVGPSVVEGLGVFARRSFRAGDRIRRVNVVRQVTAKSPIREDLGERLDHCAYPNGKVVLLGIPDRHINHSCDPNAYELFEDDSSYIVARRDIRAGEEITLDYNINITGGTAWPCRCRSTRCRGEVVGDFFGLPSEWQREYRPFLTSWFVERNRDRVQALDSEYQV
jgi:SET domain-containing protein